MLRLLGKQSESMEEIQHFLHEEHPLKLVQMEADHGETVPDHRERACAGCPNVLQGKVYACDACGFHLHDSCASLPREMEHPLHPCPLVLKLVPNHEDEGGVTLLSYRCEACNFEVDAVCSQFHSINSGEGILHFSHPHPLELSYEEADAAQRCNGCKELISGESYACRSCRYYLHGACSNLPRKIRHFFHPCTLSLETINSERRCTACSKVCHNPFVYCCEKCGFNMHVECTKFQSINPEEEGILHVSHHHPLRLSYVDAYVDCHCNICNKPIPRKTYACQSCGFYLDEPCAKLPFEIQHFLHPCPLFLIFMAQAKCDACCKHDIRNNISYHCQNCNFTMHVECTKFQPIAIEDGVDRIQHLSHLHPLQLFEAQEKDFGKKRNCVICRRKISSELDDYATCELCSFRTHKSCLDLPRKIQHHCHPCPLFFGPPQQFNCNTCSSTRSWSSSYQCKKCGFYMDVSCALFSQEIFQGDRVEHILHFSHHHPLRLFKDLERHEKDKIMQRRLKCLVCGSVASGLTYGCKQCDIYLHKFCLDILPQTIYTAHSSSVLTRNLEGVCYKCNGDSFIKSFIFREVLFNLKKPRCWCIPCALEKALSIRVSPSSIVVQLHFHPCSLTLKLFSTFTCNACFTHCNTHAYHCEQCDFYVGIKCAQISTESSEDKGKWKKHYCHWHHVQPFEDMEAPRALCSVCQNLCLEPSYFCRKCNFYIHKSCLEILPQKIDDHYFNCTLVLLTTSSYKCLACQKENNSGLIFRSIERGFKLCMECVLWPKNKLNDNGTFTSIHHWHQLVFVNNLGKDASCVLCGGKGSTLMYYCSQCEDYFHKTCAELPMKIQHSLHQQHSLTLTSNLALPESSKNCTLCLRDLLIIGQHSGVYYCKECGFQLDKKCATSVPSIQYEGDSHFLTIVENMHGQEVCQVCFDPSPRKENIVFRCAECKFTLHLECGPLPCKIKHPYHVHSLLLEDFYVEENYTDKFACHICEDCRDPRLPVYRCAEGCSMICEISCMISEVIPILLGDNGDVELRTTYPSVVSKVIPKDGTLKSKMDISAVRYPTSRQSSSDIKLTKHWNTALTTIGKYWDATVLENRGKAFDKEDKDEEKDMFKFSKEAFVHFSRKFGYLPFFLEMDEFPDFIQQDLPRVPRSGYYEPRERTVLRPRKIFVRYKKGTKYKIPKNLVPIYKEFLDKYNILGKFFEDQAEEGEGQNRLRETLPPLCRELFGESNFLHGQTSEHDKKDSRISGSPSLLTLCDILLDMRMTKMVDVTLKRVCEWLTLLEVVKKDGSDVGFVFDKIKLVWEAHFLIKAKEIVDDKSHKLHEEAMQLAREEEDLLKKLKETREKMEKNKKEQEDHNKYVGDGIKALRKDLADNLLIKWKPAISVFNLDQQPQVSKCSSNALDHEIKHQR